MNINAEILNENGKGYLIIKDVKSSEIKDIQIGSPLARRNAKNSLEITFKDKSTTESVTDSIKLKPESIKFVSNDINGYKIELPASVNNTLYRESNRFNSSFSVSVREFEIETGQIVGETYNLFAPVTKSLELMIEPPSLEKENIGALNNSTLSNTALNGAECTVQESVIKDGPINYQNTANSKKKSILPLILIILLILLALGVLGYFLFNYLNSKDAIAGDMSKQALEQVDDSNKADENKADDTDTQALDDASKANENTAVSAQSSSTVNGCSISNPNDADLIKACIQASVSSDEIIELSIKAFANNRCNLGKRLFSSIGRKDGDVAFAYAKYFDKNSSVSSQCEQKNEKMAIYWYEKAYSLNESDEAQEALSKLKGE